MSHEKYLHLHFDIRADSVADHHRWRRLAKQKEASDGVKLTEFSNFIKAEPLKVTLISFDPPDARVVLRWGAMTYGQSEEADRFMLTDPMDARVIVIDSNGNEQHYSFWLRPKIGSMQLSQPYPPMPKLDISNIMLITQDIVNTQSKWK